MEIINLFFNQQSADNCLYFKHLFNRWHSIPLEIMPHYVFLRDWINTPYDKNNPYYKYISYSWVTDDFSTIKKQIDKYLSLYKDVIKTKRIEDPVKLLKMPNEDNYLIVDGNHRCSISKLTGVELNYKIISINEWLDMLSCGVSPYAKSKEGLFYQTFSVNSLVYSGRRVDLNERTKLIREDDLVGKKILDLGCNIGIQCYKAKESGATKVLGIDIIKEITSLACRLNNFYKKPDIDFINYDLNNVFEHDFDTIFCFSIDAHINNKEALILTLKKAKKCIYLECHSGYEKYHYDYILTQFPSHELLGYCSDGIHTDKKTRAFYRISVN